MRKLAPVRVSYWGDLLAFTCLHVFCRSLTKTKTSSWINKSYACATRSSLPADRFHTAAERVVVTRLHDTVAKFRTGVEFSFWYNNRG